MTTADPSARARPVSFDIESDMDGNLRPAPPPVDEVDDFDDPGSEVVDMTGDAPTPEASSAPQAATSQGAPPPASAPAPERPRRGRPPGRRTRAPEPPPPRASPPVGAHAAPPPAPAAPPPQAPLPEIKDDHYELRDPASLWMLVKGQIESGQRKMALRDVGIQFFRVGQYGQPDAIVPIEPRYLGDQFCGDANITAGEAIINALIDGPHRNAGPTSYKARIYDRRNGQMIRESEAHPLEAWHVIDGRKKQRERELQEKAWADYHQGGPGGAPSMVGSPPSYAGPGYPPYRSPMPQVAPPPVPNAPVPPAAYPPQGSGDFERRQAEMLGYQRGVIEYQQRMLEEHAAAAREGRAARIEPPPAPPPSIVMQPVAPPAPAPPTALDQMDQMIAFLERQAKINALMGMGRQEAPAVPPELSQELTALKMKIAEMEAEKRANAAIEEAKRQMAASMPRPQGGVAPGAAPAPDSLSEFLKRRDEDERTLERLKSRLGLMGAEEIEAANNVHPPAAAQKPEIPSTLKKTPWGDVSMPPLPSENNDLNWQQWFARAATENPGHVVRFMGELVKVLGPNTLKRAIAAARMVGGEAAEAAAAVAEQVAGAAAPAAWGAS